MNDDQAYRIRLMQYLLAKDDQLTEQIIEKQKILRRKTLCKDDYMDLWLLFIKLECFRDFASDIWKLLR